MYCQRAIPDIVNSAKQVVTNQVTCTTHVMSILKIITSQIIVTYIFHKFDNKYKMLLQTHDDCVDIDNDCVDII